MSSCHQSGVQQKKGKKESINSNAIVKHQVQFKDSINKKDLKIQNNSALKDTNLGLMVKNFYEKLTNAYRSHESDIYRNTNIGVSSFRTWIKKDTFENKIVMYQIANKRAVFKYEKYKVLDQDHFGNNIFRDSSFYSAIVFYSNDNNKVITTYDIQLNNPFKKSKFQNISYNNILLDESSPALSFETQDTISYQEILNRAAQYYSNVDISYIDENHTCIIYHLEPLDSLENSLGIYSTIVILDTLGNIILNQPIYKDVQGVHLTPDGNTLAVIYGGYFGFSGITRSGLRIYRVKNKDLTIEHQQEWDDSNIYISEIGAIPTIKSIDKYSAMENFINTSIFNPNDQKENTLLIDPSEKKIYSIFSNPNKKLIQSNYKQSLKELNWDVSCFQLP